MRTLLALVLLPFVAGCDALGRSAEPVPFLNRADAAQVRVETPGTSVFRSAAEWETFWTENHENRYQQLPTPPVPAVDFGARMLVGVFWGPQGGCATNTTSVEAVERVERTGESLRVEVGPLGDLGVCRAISWPLQVVEVPRVEGEVSFGGRVPARP